MNNKLIPSVIQEFVVENIGSVAQLELLIYVSSEQERDWTAEDLSFVLRANPSAIQNYMVELYGRGLINRRDDDGGETYFRYDSDTGNHQLILLLGKYYRSHRTSIISLIYPREY